MISIIDVARKKFEDGMSEEARARYVQTDKDGYAEFGDYKLPVLQSAWENFLAGFVAAQEWDAVLPGTYEDVNGQVVFDLEKLAIEQIKDAAKESKWIPAEYYMNDWIYDVCEYLRNGVQTPET